MLLHDMHLIDSHFPHKAAALCFIWARVPSTEDGALTLQARAPQLDYVDFLEALVRVATMKALPTEHQLQAAGVADAGAFFSSLRQQPHERDKFVLENTPTFGTLKQPADLCVWRLLECIASRVVTNAAGAKAGSVARRLQQLTRHTAQSYRETGALSVGEAARRRGLRPDGVGARHERSSPPTERREPPPAAIGKPIELSPVISRWGTE